ncbi:MAG: YigZ family protein [Muribaculaceae bacterium]|nr:YigZ family protein [Muribaculaceae bacterium]
MTDKYRTITSPAEASLTEKRSHFLAFAFPIASAGEAKALVKEFTKKYYDARHVCWAYMLGADRREFLSTDNGEPSGTAGKPILGQINSLELTNVIVLVVRYFGGIKLGTPGLIAAYKESARLALDAAEIVERHETRRITFTFPYLSMNDVMKAVKDPEITVLERNFDNACSLTLEIRADLAESLHDKLSDIPGVSFPD